MGDGSVGQNGEATPLTSDLAVNTANGHGRARRLGAGPVEAGAHNRRLVLQMIGRAGSLTRAEVTRRTGLTAQSSSVIVADLQRRGYLVEIERKRGGRGYPSRQFAINPQGAYAIGVSLDHDDLSVALIDLDGQVRASHRGPVETSDPQGTFDLIARVAHSLADSQNIDWQRVVGLGIGVPGRYDPRQAVLLPTTDYPAWRNLAVAGELQSRLGIDVYWDNNATAAAIGECFRGAGIGYDNVFYVYLSHGIGSGLVLDGEPYRGAASNAGELGRVRVSLANEVPPVLPKTSPEPGPDIGNGAGTSRPGLYPRLTEVASFKALTDSLASVGKTVSTPDDLTTLFHDSDPDLVAWIAQTSDAFTEVLCSIIYLLDPEAIVFGGTFPGEVTDEIIAQVRLGLETRLFRWHGVPTVVRGAVGPDASALGAAMLPLHASFAPGS